MAWTYDETDLATDLNWVRYKLGDTTQDTHSPSDELVTYWLDTLGDKYKAAAELARHLARIYGRLSTTAATSGTVKIGGMSLEESSSASYTQAKDFYEDLARELDDGDGGTGTAKATPSYAETDSIFSVGMMDNGWTDRDPTDIIR